MNPFNTSKVGIFEWAVFVCCFLFLTGNCLAQKSLVAEDLIRSGKKYYENGYHDKAIHQFSKALLIEPKNQEALEYLGKMGLSGGVYGQPESQLDKIHELSEEIAAYQTRVGELSDQQDALSLHLQEEKQRLENLIIEKEREKELLLNDHEELRAVAEMKLKEQQEQLAVLAASEEAKTREIVKLHTNLYSLKNELSGGLDELINKKQEMEQIRIEFEQYKKDEESAEKEYRQVQMNIEQERLALEKERDDLKHEVFTVENDKQQKMKAFEDVLRQKNAELFLEKNKSVANSYELAKQRQNVLDLRTKLESLRQEKSRLSQESDDLKEQIHKIKLAKKQTPVKINGDQWIDHIKRQDDIIVNLKSRLIILKDEVASFAESDNSGQVLELTNQIESLKKEIQEKEEELKFSGQKQDMLKMRLEEHQKRLKIVDEMIREKEEHILFLEEQVGLYSNAPVYGEK
ncbi:MAG: hypothetical protein AB1650_06555 [Candidatus Omnitrophota bacterium]